MKILREKIFGSYWLSREIERQSKIRDLRGKRRSSVELEALGNVHDSINSRAMLGPEKVNDRLRTTMSLGKFAKRKEAEEMDRQSRSIGKGKIDIPTDKELAKSGYKKVRGEAIDQVDRGDYFRKMAKEREQESSQAKLAEFDSKKAIKRNQLMKKQEKQAEELRKNNKLGIAARDAKRNAKKWIRENPGKSAAIGATVAATGAGLGYAAYKHHKNKRKDGDKEK